MKARELAAVLLSLADTHGDLDVVHLDVAYDVHDRLVAPTPALFRFDPDGSYSPITTSEKVFSFGGTSCAEDARHKVVRKDAKRKRR